MERIPFSIIIQESWRISFTRASFFIFGLFMALPFVGQFFLPTQMTEKAWFTFFQTHPLLIFFVLFTLSLSKLFGKSNLIVALHHLTKEKTPLRIFSFQSLWKNFVKGVFIDTLLFVFFLLLFAILLLPSLFSFLFLGTLPHALPFLGLLIFLPVALMSFFIREFSFFYLVLSPLSLRASFEASTTLFMKHRNVCLLFGLFTLLIGVLFTFSLNLAMLGIVALFRGNPFLSEEGALVGTSLFFLSWYEIFWQALWLNFFKRLATPKNKAPEEAHQVGYEEKISEIPSV